LEAVHPATLTQGLAENSGLEPNEVLVLSLLRASPECLYHGVSGDGVTGSFVTVKSR
jgi:hypothetical protein